MVEDVFLRIADINLLCMDIHRMGVRRVFPRVNGKVGQAVFLCHKLMRYLMRYLVHSYKFTKREGGAANLGVFITFNALIQDRRVGHTEKATFFCQEVSLVTYLCVVLVHNDINLSG